MKKLIVSLIGVAIIGFIAFKLAINKKKINQTNQPVKRENVRIPITISTAKQEVQQASLIKTGMLAPFQEVKVVSVSSGTIKRLLFKLGDQVRQGQALAIIDTRSLEIDLEKSVSNVSKLKRDLDTYTELLAGNAATQEKVSDINQSYNDAKNNVQQLRRQISEATIIAPASGIIGTKVIEEGMFVSINAELASIVNLSQVKVQVYLTESDVYQIRTGQKIKLTTDVYPDRSFFGTITFISPQANQANNYQVEITAANQRDAPLRSGTFVHADFSGKGIHKILLIPREALLESSQDASVYVAENGVAVLRSIRAGAEYGSNIEVREGLKVGDQVITSGQINLRDGALIKISK